MRRTTRGVVACLVGLTLGPGCASRTRTVTTEQRVHSPAAGAQQTTPPVTVEKETTTTVTTIRDEPRGVLSTTVHIVGEILALPFRLIGGLLRLIF